MYAREGFTDAEKKRMTLSQDTLEGLRMSGINTCILNLVKIMHFLPLLSLLICGDGSVSPFSEAWTLSFI